MSLSNRQRWLVLGAIAALGVGGVALAQQSENAPPSTYTAWDPLKMGTAKTVKLSISLLDGQVLHVNCVSAEVAFESGGVLRLTSDGAMPVGAGAVADEKQSGEKPVVFRAANAQPETLTAGELTDRPTRETTTETTLETTTPTIKEEQRYESPGTRGGGR